MREVTTSAEMQERLLVDDVTVNARKNVVDKPVRTSKILDERVSVRFQHAALCHILEFIGFIGLDKNNAKAHEVKVERCQRFEFGTLNVEQK